MNLYEAEILIEELMYTTEWKYKGFVYDVRDYRFEWLNSKKVFGRCAINRKVILISAHLVECNTWETVKNAVLHEIAHAIHWKWIRGASHDENWRRIALDLGCDGKQYYSPEEVNPGLTKYTLVCPVCGRKVPKHKRSKRERSCGVCDPYRYNPKFKLMVIQNY